MTKKEEAIEVEGVVTEALANMRFRVQIEGGHKRYRPRRRADAEAFHPHRAGRQGPRGVSPYDLTKGRITYRER